MPDRSLKPDELFRFVREHKTGKLFIALKQLDEEGTEPSLHDLCLQELRGMTEAHANIIIQQGKQIILLSERVKALEEKESESLRGEGDDKTMSLLEGYIARWKKYPTNEVKIRVARPSILSPSEDLLRATKKKKIDWKEYERRFRQEILSNPAAMEKLREIKELAKTKNVRLICYEKEYPCHRFILIEMIKELKP